MSLFSELRGAIGDARAPDAFFPDARFDDIDTNPELAAHLFRQFEARGKHFGRDVGKLKSAIGPTVESWRGGPDWEAIGIPKDYPTDLADHQFRNLVERLYLSAYGNQSKRQLYGASASDVELRKKLLLEVQRKQDQTVFAGAAFFVGVAIVGAWLYRRRGQVAGANARGDK